MAVLKAGDVGRVLVGAADHAEEAIGPRTAADNHTFLITSDHTKLPVLSDRYSSYDRLELLQGGEPLAHVEPGVHIRHGGEGSARSKGKYDRATERPVANTQAANSIRVQSAKRNGTRSRG
jgi:hypothetical protein